MPARASPTAPGSLHPSSASAVRSTLHGTQASHPPVPSATATPPAAGDVAVARHSVAAAPAPASPAAAHAEATAAAAPSVSSSPTPNPLAPSSVAANTLSGSATGTTWPRSQCDPSAVTSSCTSLGS